MVLSILWQSLGTLYSLLRVCIPTKLVPKCLCITICSVTALLLLHPATVKFWSRSRPPQSTSFELSQNLDFAIDQGHGLPVDMAEHDVVHPTSTTPMGKLSDDEPQSRDQWPRDIQEDQTKDQSQPPDNPYDSGTFNLQVLGSYPGPLRPNVRHFSHVSHVELDQSKAVAPTVSYINSISDQSAEKGQGKIEYINRTTVHWETIDEWSAKDFGDFDPTEPPNLLTTNMTNATGNGSERCYTQVHIWSERHRFLSATGRVGYFECPGLPCGLRLVINKDTRDLDRSDAVILNHGTLWDWRQMYRFRPPNQRWIFYTMESPANTNRHLIPPRDVYNTAYDYIMTYRSSESHLYASYGYYMPYKKESQFTEIRNWAENKTMIVASMSSNCNLLTWDRPGFVDALSEYIPVSQYGRCGSKFCERGQRCQRKLRRHMFFLALENSACREYITEKVWSNAFFNELVPVVFGAPREDYQRLLPPNSFIYVEDFPSVKSLAEYLWKLHKNETLYNAYFEWKKLGSVGFTPQRWLLEPEQICSIVVAKLLEDQKAMEEGTFQRPTYPDWNEWWTNSCMKLNRYGFPIKLK